VRGHRRAIESSSRSHELKAPLDMCRQHWSIDVCVCVTRSVWE
jgi:hypothetical protein